MQIFACVYPTLDSGDVKLHYEACKAKRVRKCPILSVKVRCTVSFTTSVKSGQNDIFFTAAALPRWGPLWLSRSHSVKELPFSESSVSHTAEPGHGGI